MNEVITTRPSTIQTNGNHARQPRTLSTSNRFRRDVVDTTTVIITVAKAHNKNAFFKAIIDQLELIMNRRIAY